MSIRGRAEWPRLQERTDRRASGKGRLRPGRLPKAPSSPIFALAVVLADFDDSKRTGTARGGPFAPGARILWTTIFSNCSAGRAIRPSSRNWSRSWSTASARGSAACSGILANPIPDDASGSRRASGGCPTRRSCGILAAPQMYHVVSYPAGADGRPAAEILGDALDAEACRLGEPPGLSSGLVDPGGLLFPAGLPPAGLG